MNRLLRREDGIAVTELALVTPVFLLMFLSSIELGHMIYYSIAVEKGLRSAVTYAGRIETHSPATKQNTINIVKTGEPSGTHEFLVDGWADADANVIFTEKTFLADISGTQNDQLITVIAVTAEVPYVPVVGVLVPALEYLMKNSFRKDKLFITLTHEQAIIGN